MTDSQDTQNTGQASPSTCKAKEGGEQSSHGDCWLVCQPCHAKGLNHTGGTGSGWSQAYNLILSFTSELWGVIFIILIFVSLGVKEGMLLLYVNEPSVNKEGLHSVSDAQSCSITNSYHYCLDSLWPSLLGLFIFLLYMCHVCLQFTLCLCVYATYVNRRNNCLC